MFPSASVEALDLLRLCLQPGGPDVQRGKRMPREGEDPFLLVGAS